MKKNKKISLFLPSLAGGGAERVAVTLANEFVAQGLLVDVVLACEQGLLADELDPLVRVVCFKKKRLLLSFFSLCHYLYVARPDALISGLWHANLVAALARFFYFRKLSFVVVEHNTFSRYFYGFSKARTLLVKTLVALLYHSPDYVIAVSKGAADDLEKEIGKDVKAIYNPIPLSTIALKKSQITNSAIFSAGVPVIVAAGRLMPEKNFFNLLDAFFIARKSVDVRLVILGEGPLRPLLEQKIKSSEFGADVLLAGFQRNPYAWFSKSALFVLSSDVEGFGNVLIEAMACGVPVISTDCPSGPSEILEHGRWGQLVPVGDSALLADAMVTSLISAQHPDVLCRASDFSAKKIADQYLALCFK